MMSWDLHFLFLWLVSHPSFFFDFARACRLALVRCLYGHSFLPLFFLLFFFLSALRRGLGPTLPPLPPVTLLRLHHSFRARRRQWLRSHSLTHSVPCILARFYPSGHVGISHSHSLTHSLLVFWLVCYPFGAPTSSVWGPPAYDLRTHSLLFVTFLFFWTGFLTLSGAFRRGGRACFRID